MSFEIWLAFAVTSGLILAIPGPTVIFVVGEALARGRQTAWTTVPGVALGDLLAMTVSLAGAGAILATSATLFTLLKLGGAAYLIWIGIQMWRHPPDPLNIKARHSAGATFLRAFVITALNPKSIVFFIAFVPQFLTPEAALIPQFALMVFTFVGLATLNAVLWALAAGQMRAIFNTPAAVRRMARAGGTFLIGAGAITAFAKRA